MRLMFINGSRGDESNTDRLMEHFIRGFLETEGNACRTEYLVKYRQNLQTLTEKFSAAENVIHRLSPLHRCDARVASRNFWRF